ncbi:SelB C-terminal domain-containing protein [Anaerotruncus colihominis]|uniref:SelB domain-containing protein n=1 Tax=Anaerotruncus colihominis TaxID=169435 RepID=UPI003C6C104F
MQARRAGARRARALLFTKRVYGRARYCADFARAAGPAGITLAGLRDALGISRKYAQALLEHFDAAGLTVRDGDTHIPKGDI